nr:carbohydrate ABC transporter permease [Lachnospiraceae bacterium]
PPAVSLQSFIEGYLILGYDHAIWTSILNSLVLAFFQTASAALAAYTFARLKFKGSNILFGLVVFTIIVPAQSIMLAQYTSFRHFDIFGLFKLIRGEDLNLIGSSWAAYLLAATGMGVKGGLYIYILRQSYRQLPVSIEEAAYVDGAGFLKTFVHIVLPGVSATLLTVSVLSFVWNYADTYYLSLLMGSKAGTSQLAIRLVNVQNNMRWAIMDIEKYVPSKYVVNFESPLIQKGVACACAILVIAPLIILYFFIQKRFVQGVERSGLGGD